MPVLNNWKLDITIDQVLRAQGADPEIIRDRRPKLIEAAQEAILRGNPLLHPVVLFERYKVKGLQHERLDLIPNKKRNGRYYLSGQLIAQHLAKAEEIIVMVCTIGGELEESVSSTFKVDQLIAMAMDGLGSAAAETLAIAACNYFELQSANLNLKTSMPLNPGMVGWSVDVGQPQVFSLIDSEEINVTLTESWMMVPNKSLSIVMGVGKELVVSGTTCEFCTLKDTCRYQDHYVAQK